jgi:hypothetical protein
MAAALERFRLASNDNGHSAGAGVAVPQPNPFTARLKKTPTYVVSNALLSTAAWLCASRMTSPMKSGCGSSLVAKISSASWNGQGSQV